MNMEKRGTVPNASSEPADGNGLQFSEMSFYTTALAQGGTLRKRNRWRRRVKKSRRRYPGRNKHHMLPASRNGSGDRSNLLYMKISRHERLHRLFGTMSWDEIRNTLASIFGVGEPKKVVELMDRVSRAKKRIA